LSEAIEKHQQQGISNDRKETLLADKVLRLVQRHRMQDLSIPSIKQQLTIEMHSSNFNLYRFAKKYF